MNYSLKIKLLELTQRALMVRADAQPDNGDKWRTTETGSKILLGKDGTVKGGMGGKFTGLNISEVKKKSEEESHGSLTNKAISKTKAKATEKGRIESGYNKDLEKYKENKEEIKQYWKNRDNAKKEHLNAIEEYKDKLKDYQALSAAEKRKKDKWGLKLHQKPDYPQMESAPREIKKPNIREYFEETDNEFNVNTQHETSSADLFSERGAAKTTHEFEGADHAENYLESIDNKLTSSGYQKKETGGAVTYTKGNHVFNVSHNLDDEDNEDNYNDDGDFIGKVSVKSGYLDSSLQGAEPISKQPTEPANLVEANEDVKKYLIDRYSKELTSKGLTGKEHAEKLKAGFDFDNFDEYDWENQRRNMEEQPKIDARDAKVERLGDEMIDIINKHGLHSKEAQSKFESLNESEQVMSHLKNYIGNRVDIFARKPTEPANPVEVEKKTLNSLTKENESNKISSPSQTEAGKSGDNKMSVNIENPVYDVTLGLSKKDFGMQELKKVIKESGDEAGIIFATNYVEKNMAGDSFGADELLKFANKKTKKAAKEKAKLEKEEAAKLAETQAQEEKADKYLAEYGGLEGAKAYALSVGVPQETIDKAFDTARLALSNNLELIKSKLFNFKKAGKGDLGIIEKAKESHAEKEKNKKEFQVKEKNEKAVEKTKTLFIDSVIKGKPNLYSKMSVALAELKNLGFDIEKLEKEWRYEQQ